MLYSDKFTRRFMHMRIFLFALLLGWALPGIAQNATVAEGTHVNLRAGKTDNYRILRILSPGTLVEIVEITQDMAKVKTKEGDTGWMPARLLIVEPMDNHPPAPTPCRGGGRIIAGKHVRSQNGRGAGPSRRDAMAVAIGRRLVLRHRRRGGHRTA